MARPCPLDPRVEESSDFDGYRLEKVSYQGIETIRRAYEAVLAEGEFTSFIEPGVGHELTPKMWEHVRTTFAKYLLV